MYSLALVLDNALEEKKASRAIYILWSYEWKRSSSQGAADCGSKVRDANADSWKAPPVAIVGDYCTRWEHVLEDLKGNKQAKLDWAVICEQKMAETHPHMQDQQAHSYTVNEDLELVYPFDIATPAALTVARRHLVYYFEEGGFRTDANRKMEEKCDKLLEEKRELQDKLAL